MGKILLVASITLAACGQIALKYGVTSLTPSLSGKAFYRDAVHNPFIILGGFFYLISAILWVRVLSLIPLSIAYPSVGGTYILVVLLSRVIFQEPLNIWKIAGVLLISAGITLLSKSA
ncbi:MAG: DMT family transporter [bacterium]